MPSHKTISHSLANIHSKLYTERERRYLGVGDARREKNKSDNVIHSFSNHAEPDDCIKFQSLSMLPLYSRVYCQRPDNNKTSMINVRAAPRASPCPSLPSPYTNPHPPYHAECSHAETSRTTLGDEEGKRDGVHSFSTIDWEPTRVAS